MSSQAWLCCEAIAWFAVPPTDPRLTHASIVKESPTSREELCGTLT